MKAFVSWVAHAGIGGLVVSFLLVYFIEGKWDRAATGFWVGVDLTVLFRLVVGVVGSPCFMQAHLPPADPPWEKAVKNPEIRVIR